MPDTVAAEALERLPLGDRVKLAPWEIEQWVAVLGEYSCSLPTGMRIGKRWMLNVNAYTPRVPGQEHDIWYIGEYTHSNRIGQIGIRWRLVEIDTEKMAQSAAELLGG